MAVSTAGQEPTQSAASGTQTPSTTEQAPSQEATQPQAGSQPSSSTTQQQATATEQTSITAEMPDVNDAQAWNGMPPWIKALRTEAAGNRVKANTLQQKVDELEREKMSEQQRLQADYDKLKSEVIPEKDQEIRKLQVQIKAGEKGVVDTETVVALLDWSSIGSETNAVDAAIEQLLERKPFLKANAAQASSQPTQQVTANGAQASSTSATAPNTQENGGATPSFTRSQLESMSLAEYEAKQEQIDAALVAGKVDLTR